LLHIFNAGVKEAVFSLFPADSTSAQVEGGRELHAAAGWMIKGVIFTKLTEE